jgi:hypothetical protein
MKERKDIDLTEHALLAKDIYLIDDKTFDEFGHIYYSRGKRHESNG